MTELSLVSCVSIYNTRVKTTQVCMVIILKALDLKVHVLGLAIRKYWTGYY